MIEDDPEHVQIACDTFSRCDPYSYVSYAAPGRQISRYALRGDRTAFLFVFVREQPFPQHPNLPEARKVLRDVFSRDRWIECDEILQRLEECDDFYFGSVSQIHMPKWSHNRIASLGDAAFCPSLLAGEGAGLAMAAAYILSGELQHVNGEYKIAILPSAIAFFVSRPSRFCAIG